MKHERLIAGVLCLAVIAVFAWSAVARQPVPRAALPEGCDDFGYLNMAQAMDEGTWLSDHARRPFHDDLVAHLEAAGARRSDYAWMVAPHAYHVDDRTDRVINQYPPATSLMLSLLPLETRRTLAPGLWALIVMLPLTIAFRWAGALSPLAAVAWATVAAAGVLWSGPSGSLSGGTNSFAPTIGLLVAAGWSLRSHPVAALALVSATVPFRIGNALLLAPAFLVLLAHAPPPTTWREFLPRALRGGAAALGGGLFLYLIYATVLLGAPWAFTYSPIDREWAGADVAWANLANYLDHTKPWLRFHFVGLLLLAGLAWREGTARWFLAGLLFASVNYLFFIFHQVRIDHYPYASGLLILGLVLRGFAETGFPGPKLITLAAAAAVAWAATGLGEIDLDGARDEFEAERQIYREAFGDFDVVWGEHRTGTVEYATRGSTFRYKWGPPELRYQTMRWLRARGLRQAIWAGDRNMPDGVADELQGAGIHFGSSQHPSLGEILILEPGA